MAGHPLSSTEKAERNRLNALYPLTGEGSKRAGLGGLDPIFIRLSELNRRFSGEISRQQLTGQTESAEARFRESVAANVARTQAGAAQRRTGIAEQEQIARDKLLQEVRDAQVRAESARVRAEIFKQHRFSELPQVAQDNINRIEEKGAVRNIKILRAL